MPKKTAKPQRKPPTTPAKGKKKAVQTLDPPAPKLKKDGTPWKPWSDEVRERAEKRAAKIAAGVPVFIPARPCTAMTTGIHGPKRPCAHSATPGLTVCWIHGGGTKAAQAAAKRRLTEQLDPTVARLIELRDQDAHLPTALGAATHILNRVMGKADSVDKDKGAGRPIINIGIALGGIPTKGQTVTVNALPEPSEDGEVLDGE